MGNGMIGRNRQDFTVNFRKIDFIVFFFWYNWLNIDDFQLFSNELGESKRRKMYEKGTWFGYGSRSAGGNIDRLWRQWPRRQRSLFQISA